MLLFAALVGGSFVLGRQIANDIDPLVLTALRFVIGAITLTITALLLGQLERRYFSGLWRYAAMGACMALYFVTMFEGLKTASAVSMSATFTLTPVMSAIFGWILMRQIASARIVTGLMVGAVGAVWVIFRADIQALLGFQIGQGEAIFLLGCVSHALYTPLVRFVNRGEPVVIFSAGMLVAGAALLCLIGAPRIVTTDWLSLSINVWMVIAYLSLVTTAITFFLVQFATMRLPAAKVMAYTYLVPSMVILWDAAMGAAMPAPLVLIGIVLTILALLILLKD